MTITANAVESANASATDEVWLMLLDITHPDLSEPIRVVNNNENITSNGNLYIAYAFSVELPGDNDDVPRVQLRIDNVDRVIVDSIRAIDTRPATAILRVILASAPDDIIAEFNASLQTVDYDQYEVTGTFGTEAILSEPFPGHTFTPSSHPGLFGFILFLSCTVNAFA